MLCLGVMLNRHVLELTDGVIRQLDQLDTAAKASSEPSLYGTFECLLEDLSERELGGAPRIVYSPSPETIYHVQALGPYEVHNCDMTALAAIADEIQDRLPMEYPELVLPVGLTRSVEDEIGEPLSAAYYTNTKIREHSLFRLQSTKIIDILEQQDARARRCERQHRLNAQLAAKSAAKQAKIMSQLEADTAAAVELSKKAEAARERAEVQAAAHKVQALEAQRSLQAEVQSHKAKWEAQIENKFRHTLDSAVKSTKRVVRRVTRRSAREGAMPLNWSSARSFRRRVCSKCIPGLVCLSIAQFFAKIPPSFRGHGNLASSP